MSWSDWKTYLGDNFGTLTNIAASGKEIDGALNNAENTRALGNQIQDYLTGMSSDLNTGSQFQGMALPLV